ncbi:alpha/beta hydrolase [Thermocatellispora tengchongensis]|uniref:alpha/beta hydrolase n=1 Tax=Thermocatellispora tengchongensis TaxID=1073253 RepID=UPI0028AB0E84|nr:alpha/beta hydrolase [Thermocatellispora tengchongensis]
MVSVGALALAAVVAFSSSAQATGASGLSAAASTGGSAAAGEPTPTPSPVPTTPLEELPGTAIETVSYGKHKRQRMDVWWQPDGLKHPAVFVIHGGWWSGGDKKSMTAVTRSYAELGYTVFNINYRLSGDAAWPAQRADALDAIATARRHAARWSFDPDKYVVLGFSAGGHIATAVGTYKDGLPGLKGVVGISPVVSPLTSYADGAETTDTSKRKLRASAIKLAGGCEPTGKCAKVWASMEVPWHASRGDAPMLTVHSEDEFVPPYQSELLKEQLRQVGVPMSIRTVPGIEHSAPLYRILGVAEGVQEWIAQKLQ